MTRAKRTYPAVTWDQASRMQLATVVGLQALGYEASTLRNWAADGRIHPVATAPGGGFLYHVPSVNSAAEWLKDQR